MTSEVKEAVAPAATNGMIICQIDGQYTHSIQLHIKNNHADTWTLDKYKAEYPDAPLLSPYAEEMLRQRLAAKKEAGVQPAAPAATQTAHLIDNSGISRVSLTTTSGPLHEVFELGNAPAARSSSGTPINVSIMTGHDDIAISYLPDTDREYIFNIDLLKKVIAGFELAMPILLWGFHGTGKTTVLQQVAARTKRPFIRVQHTINMQESDVLGQWTVRDNATIFQLGPLPTAMLNGWVYCADEYDFAMPSVLSVYQPVLEGQALLIKDAPPHLRKITPHPNFRFCATGNTNGTGDETGLYQGTLVQNAANYSRFKITEEVQYMAAYIETNILESKTRISKPEAKKIVKFANDVREMFREHKISMTISPREMISAAQLGIAFGGNWELGIKLAFANRLPRVDKQVVEQYMQRIFA